MSTATAEQVLESIVDGINSGNLDTLMPLYEREAAFATQPGSLAHGAPGVRETLTGFVSMKGKLDLEVTRVLEVDDLALVVGVWSFNGTGPDGEPVRLAAKNADVLRRQTDGSWRFVIDNPWGRTEPPSGHEPARRSLWLQKRSEARHSCGPQRFLGAAELVPGPDPSAAAAAVRDGPGSLGGW